MSNLKRDICILQNVFLLVPLTNNFNLFKLNKKVEILPFPLIILLFDLLEVILFTLGENRICHSV